LKFASIAFAIVALVTGLLAAHYWHSSSKVSFNPDRGPQWGLPGTGASIEPLTTGGKAVELGIANMKDLEDAIATAKKAAELNKIAALLTGISVAASGISAILGTLSNHV
jgi:hypothetical protein